MNKVLLQGRLTADPEVYTNGFTSTRFTLAVNRRFKDDQGSYKADFISCQATNKTAELIAQYCHKGTPISVVGEWRTGSYEKDGVTRYTNTCYVTEFYFLPSSSSNASEANSMPSPALNSRTRQATPEPAQASLFESNQTTEPDTIPQAFDADIDMSDEFPW